MAEYCRVAGIECYLPLRAETKVYQRRKVTVHKPVFPGYIFASFSREQRAILLKSNNIVRFLRPENQTEFLHELAQIRAALNVDPTLGACEALRRGRRVRITGGPFLGVEGLVSAVKGATRVLLNVEMIGRAVAVEVAPEYLEILD